MERPECAVKGCNNKAFLAFGNKWICGECYMKIQTKQLTEKNRLLESIEVTG